MNRKSTSPRFAARPLGFALAAGLITALASPTAMAQEKVLRIAMTAADIPRTLGQPDQGFEGNRFTGIPMYDALTHWDLSKGDAASVLIPGLATSWTTDAADKTKWVFKLRPGVKFHDGSDLTADSVVWNVQKVLDKDAVHFDASQAQRPQDRQPHGGTHHQRARCVLAAEPDQPVHGLTGPLAEEVRSRGRCHAR